MEEDDCQQSTIFSSQYFICIEYFLFCYALNNHANKTPLPSTIFIFLMFRKLHCQITLPCVGCSYFCSFELNPYPLSYNQSVFFGVCFLKLIKQFFFRKKTVSPATCFPLFGRIPLFSYTIKLNVQASYQFSSEKGAQIHNLQSLLLQVYRFLDKWFI